MLLRILSSLLLHWIKKSYFPRKKYTLMIHLKERSVVFPWWSLFIPILNRSRIFLQWSYAEKLSLAFLTNTSQIISTHTGSVRTTTIKWSRNIVTMMAAVKRSFNFFSSFRFYFSSLYPVIMERACWGKKIDSIKNKNPRFLQSKWQVYLLNGRGGGCHFCLITVTFAR